MNNRFEFLLTLLLPACIVRGGESAATKPYVDIQVLPNGVPLALSCNGTAAGGPVQWMKDNVTVTNSEGFEIRHDGLNLEISKTVEASLGIYTCRYANSSAILSTYQVISEPVVAFASDDWSSVKEGGELRLKCITSPLYGPKITWIFRNEIYQQSRDRVKISKDENTGIEGAELIVENLTMDDYSNVTCRVHFTKINGGITIEATTYVRVKDKLAALWPFLGICAEVIVLSAVILIYEKKCNKTEVDDSDTDQGPETKPMTEKDAEVRQRK